MAALGHPPPCQGFPKNPGKFPVLSLGDAPHQARAKEYAMSLRGRVMTLVALMLLISVSIYVAISWRGARSDLAAELGAARTGGLQTVRSAFEDLPRSDHPQRDLRQLVSTFDGNRHLTAAVVDRRGRVRIASEGAMPRKLAPAWFAAAIRPDLQPAMVKVPGGGGDVLVLRPEPASDTAALWSANVSAAAVFGVAAAIGLALIYWVIGRALAPIADLSRGLGAIGASGYRERVREEGPLELHSLQRGFNAMAERLAEIDERNRALEAQLLTIQDEERAEIARDLHDEIGPHLFAVALDAGMIERCLSQGETQPILDQVHSIKNAVNYMQRQVRDLIARLRPTRAAELGLEAAINDLVAFWQGRQPEVEFLLDLDGADSRAPEPLRDVIYRVVQESVANALRHAETKQLAIRVGGTGEEIIVSVANRGTPKAPAADLPGLGLASMRERVHAVGGHLTIDRASQGWTVNARFRATAKQMVA
jgi:two-component system sensor histidine kinase UhpB